MGFNIKQKPYLPQVNVAPRAKPSCTLLGGLCQFGTLCLLYLKSSEYFVSYVSIARYIQLWSITIHYTFFMHCATVWHHSPQQNIWLQQDTKKYCIRKIIFVCICIGVQYIFKLKLSQMWWTFMTISNAWHRSVNLLWAPSRDLVTDKLLQSEVNITTSIAAQEKETASTRLFTKLFSILQIYTHILS